MKENDNKNNEKLWLFPALIFPVVFLACYFIIAWAKQADISTTGIVILFILLSSYGLMLFCAIPLNKKTDENITVKRVYYGILLVPTFLSYAIMSLLACKSTICLLNPLYFLPAFVIFWFLIKGINRKKKLIYIFCFFALPLFFIVNDYIQTWYFNATCIAKTPKPEYNPIYLSDEFFHEEVVDGEKVMTPNIRRSEEIRDLNDTENNKFSSGYIYIYSNCRAFNKDVYIKKERSDNKYKTLRELIKNSNIVLCEDYNDGYYTYEEVNSEGKRKVIAKLGSYSRHTGFGVFPGTYVNCKYNTGDKNWLKDVKKSDLDYTNYIKPLFKNNNNNY